MISRQTVSKVGSVLLLVGVAAALFLAESAYWVNHTVFNQQNFTRITTTSLLEESSRNAIAASVVDRTLADRPLVQRAIGERTEALVSGLLASDASSQALNTLTTKTYAYATSSSRDDIKIDLTTLKTFLGTLITVAQTQGGGARLEAVQAQVPDEIVLVDSQTFPDLSGVVRSALWIGPVLWLASIGFVALYIYLGRKDYARRVYTAGLVVALVAVFGLMTTPFIPPPIAASLPNIELRPVAENLTAGFLAPFRSQMWYLLAFAGVVLLTFNQRFNIIKAGQRLGDKVLKMSAGGDSQSKSRKKK